MSSKSTPSPPALTTYAKILLHNWPVTQRIISQLSSPSASSTIHERQLQQAFNSPYAAWLQHVLEACNQLSYWELTSNLHKSKTLKEALQQQKIKLPKIEAWETDAKQQKKLSKTTLETLHKQIEDCIEQQYNAWHTFHDHWCQQIIQQLAQHHIQLNEDEQAIFLRLDRSDELINQANEQQLQLDKKIYQAHQFAIYLQLKTYLASINALARQQQPADIKHVKSLLKPLKMLFSMIEKQEAEYNKTYHNELKKALIIPK